MDPEAHGELAEMTRASHRAISARRDPAWLNPATLKGAALIAIGVAVLISEESRDWIDVALGALLISWALVELWFSVVRRTRPRGWVDVAKFAIAIVAGVALAAPVGLALTVIFGVAVVGRGVFLLVEALGEDDGRERRVLIRRAIVLVLVGVVVIAIPETVALGMRMIIGAVALGVGGILLASGLRPTSSRAKDREEMLNRLDTRSVTRLTEDWLLAQRLSDARFDELTDGLYFEEPRAGTKQTSFWVMMLLATAIAAFAVIQDSTAVVIGAMLVAPLMTPIMGAAAAIVNGWHARLAASLLTVLAAVAAAVALSWLIAAWLPSVGDLATNSQIVSRTSPSLLDLCIAVAAGAAGAYASVDPRVSSSLSGVAIAVALVPPLAVVGITLQAGDYGDTGGAFLLFATNFVSIILVSIVVFVLTGFAEIPPDQADLGKMRGVIRTLLTGAVIIIVPLSLTSTSIWSDATSEADAEEAVTAWLGDDADLSVVELEVDGSDVDLIITGSGDPPPVDQLASSLESSLGETVNLTARLVPSRLLTVPS